MENFRKYAVKANSVEDFLEKYTKHDRHYGRGEEYAKERIAYYKKELKEIGFCFMSKHESVTGRVVAYFGDIALNS